MSPGWTPRTPCEWLPHSISMLWQLRCTHCPMGSYLMWKYSFWSFLHITIWYCARNFSVMSDIESMWNIHCMHGVTCYTTPLIPIGTAMTWFFSISSISVAAFYKLSGSIEWFDWWDWCVHSIFAEIPFLWKLWAGSQGRNSWRWKFFSVPQMHKSANRTRICSKNSDSQNWLHKRNKFTASLPGPSKYCQSPWSVLWWGECVQLGYYSECSAVKHWTQLMYKLACKMTGA